MSIGKSFIVFTIACLALAKANPQNINALLPERSILNFMASSSQTLQDNPTQSLACFNYYIPLIDEVAQEYQYDLSNCSSNFQKSQQSAIDATVDERNQLAKTVNGTCAVLVQCENEDTADDIFQCYINQGPVEAKALYGVATNATSQYAALEELIRQAQNIQDMCNTQAKVKYENNSTQAYAELNSCILNNTPIPSSTVAPPSSPSSSASTDNTSSSASTAAETSTAPPTTTSA
uniref:Protein TsetseEP domain-containing protein n=1 Tax=Stomoxys calcitrans TaxID=35570 RepID=A0A1I8NZM7_STOCA